MEADRSNRRGEWLQLNSGNRFWIDDYRVGDFLIEDIAHALSNTCRWAGHTDQFYSVAQHSAIVACHVPPHLRKEALLHDAAEAYLGDVPRPLKRLIRDYKARENLLQAHICTQYDLPIWLSQEIKEVDNALTVDERRCLISASSEDHDWQFKVGLGIEITPMHPRQAEQAFLLLWEALKGDNQ